MQHAVAGKSFLLPGLGARTGPVAVIARLQGDQAAEFIGGQHLLESHKISIPAAILVDGEDTFPGARKFDELASFVAGGDEGFIQNNMLVGFEGLTCELKVGGRRSADDDEIEVRLRQQLRHAARDGDAGIGVRGGIAMTLQDGGQFQAIDGLQKRRVKDAATVSKSNHASANGATHAFLLLEELSGIAATLASSARTKPERTYVGRRSPAMEEFRSRGTRLRLARLESVPAPLLRLALARRPSWRR